MDHVDGNITSNSLSNSGWFSHSQNYPNKGERNVDFENEVDDDIPDEAIKDLVCGKRKFKDSTFYFH